MKISIKREQNNACIGSAEREKVRTKFNKYLSMAALALMGAMMTACSNDDDIENQSNVVTLTTTVGFDDGATTRALTPAGVKTFAVDDQIAVMYYNTSGNTVKAVSNKLTSTNISADGKSATFTVTLKDPDKARPVAYKYPASLIGNEGDPDLNVLYGQQDGTLATLGSKCDYCSSAYVVWDGDNLPTLTLTNKFAILAITLKNSDGSSDITGDITYLTVKFGTYDTYIIHRAKAAGPIYVAIKPTTSATVEVTATNGAKKYTKTLTGKTYKAGNGYNVTWKMN